MDSVANPIASYREADREVVYGRLLHAGDFDAVTRLNRQHQKIMRRKKAVDYDRRFEEVLRTSYLNESDTRYFMFGGFSGNDLQVCLSTFVWADFPFYTIGSLKTQRGALNLFSDIRSCFSVCLEAMLEFSEARGACRFFYIRSADKWPVERILSRIEKSSPTIRRYNRVIEACIPKNTIPSYPFLWKMMVERTWPQDLIVESMTLMQGSRPLDGYRYAAKSK